MLNHRNSQSFKVERDNEPALFFSICDFYGQRQMNMNVKKKTAFSCFVDINDLV